MVKSNRVTILILCFFAVAAILNEYRPSEILEQVKTYLVMNPGIYTTGNVEPGLVEAFNLPTFILLSLSIIGGLFIIALLKLSRSGRIISTQNVLPTRQEEELQHVRQMLAEAQQTKKIRLRN
tara:strand:- start:3510 stop:3878 length:369 start_codon:yes stop_codon:yes gene_type:complete